MIEKPTIAIVVVSFDDEETAKDFTTCFYCGHFRSDHCPSGAHCFRGFKSSKPGDPRKRCSCPGFRPKSSGYVN